MPQKDKPKNSISKEERVNRSQDITNKETEKSESLPKTKKLPRKEQIEWTQEEHDHLLNLWLSGRGLRFISQTLGTNRPEESLDNRVWKLATAYGPCARYEPGPTREVIEGPLTRREIKVIEWGLYGEGQKFVPKRKVLADVYHIASVLNRPVETVQDYCDGKKRPGRGFGL